MVSSDKTGHAEAMQITYDPEKITFKALEKAFFDLHNPSTTNQQGPDVSS